MLHRFFISKTIFWIIYLLLPICFATTSTPENTGTCKAEDPSCKDNKPTKEEPAKPSPPILQFEPGRKGYKVRYPEEPRKGNTQCNTTSRVLVANYGSHGDYFRRQNVSCKSALEIGHADACVSFRPKFLDDEFRKQNQQILIIGQGAGLWLWKPYLVFHTLLAMQPGDFLFYLDTDWDLVSSFDPYICYIIQLGLDIVPFYQGFTEWEWTKQDAVVLLNVEKEYPRMGKTAQHRGGFHFFRRTSRAIRFAGEWLTYSQDPRVMTNEPSIFKKEMDGFRQNRHDQTVFSLLTKKWNIPTWPDPMTPFSKRTMTAYLSATEKLEAYNPVDTEKPNHPTEALIHNCPPNC